MLLLSDGIANVGPKTNREITRLGQHLANRGMSVSTIGLGEDYNEDLMTALAESSDANYYFVDDVEMLAEVFESELGELKSVVARKLIVDIEFPDGVKPVRFLGREETFDSAGNRGTIQFEMLAGEQQRDLLVLCKVTPKARDEAGDASVAAVHLRYEDAQSDGKVREVKAAVTAKLSDDVEVAERKVNRVVRAEAEVFGQRRRVRERRSSWLIPATWQRRRRPSTARSFTCAKCSRPLLPHSRTCSRQRSTL